MTERVSGEPIAIIAGGGNVPALIAAAAARSGRKPVVFAIEGEADPTLRATPSAYLLRWGEVGRLFRLLRENGCREAVLVGSIGRRPEFRSLRLDLGGLKLAPRILRLMRGGDDVLLRGVAEILQENGVVLVSPLEIAPDLAMPEGLLAGRISASCSSDIAAARTAGRAIGRRDIGHGAVAVNGAVVATEDAGGTDALLGRVALLRRAGVIGKPGGVLVKCMKPQQDPRLDLPTIGPETAAAAAQAGLAGVAAEAGRTLLAGRDETLEAFRQHGLFLLGLSASEAPEDG